MKVVIKKKGEGKTTELIKIASTRDGLLMVVRNQRTSMNVFHKAKELGLKIHKPITFYEFLNKRYYSRNVRGFVIDDVEDLLRFLAQGIPIYAISINKELLSQKVEEPFFKRALKTFKKLFRKGKPFKQKNVSFLSMNSTNQNTINIHLKADENNKKGGNRWKL